MRWSKNETIGFLHRFWWTVLEVSPSGDITALSSPEVMGEMLDMPVTVVAQALKAMEHPDPKQTFLDRKGGRLLVHDWLDFAGRYLSDSKFRRSPKKYAEIEALYATADNPPPVGGQSADSPRIVGDTLPTLPTQPTEPRETRARVGGDPPGGEPKPAMTQAVMDRALAVLKLYPAKAPKDGRIVAKTLADQNALAYRIAENPGYPWEEHARLVQSVKTPVDLCNWVQTMPDPVNLETLREANTKAAPAPTRNIHLDYQPPEDDDL